ncbi:MAG: hypothetical protein EB059_06270 [Alphaproteobacteria bacterium]|nr:hypothetical protein [Alphaproteobacteria bacterium]
MVTVVLMTAFIMTVILVGGYLLFQPPRPKTLGEKIDAAAAEISKGFDNAAGKLDDRSPAQRAADDAAKAAQDLADKAKAAFEGNK